MVTVHPTGVDRPLIAVRWRGVVLAIVVACLAAVAVLGVRYHQDAGPGRIDAVLDPALASTSPGVSTISEVLVVLGDPIVAVVLIALIVVGAVRARRWSAAALAVVGPGLAAVGTEFVLKPAVGRTLDGDLAFPSGTTALAMAVATVCLVLLVGAHRPRRRVLRLVAVVLVAAVPVGVAYSLVALGWHYSTDTVGGALVSVAVVLGTALVVDLVPRRRVAPTPAGEHASVSG